MLLYKDVNVNVLLLRLFGKSFRMGRDAKALMKRLTTLSYLRHNIEDTVPRVESWSNTSHSRAHLVPHVADQKLEE